MGKALKNAAEEDVKSLGVKGLVAWGQSDALFINKKAFRMGPPPLNLFCLHDLIYHVIVLSLRSFCQLPTANCQLPTANCQLLTQYHGNVWQ